MKYLLSIFPAFLAFLLIMSCNSTEKNKLLFGHWTGVEWLVGDQPSTHTPGDVTFTFDEAGRYTFSYQGTTENGTYYTNNNQLFTTPDGGIKIMVKIPKLTQDTLVFDMNRGGQAERMTLIRK